MSGSGTLKNGDIIGLQANTGSWVSAANGGGSAVFAYGGSLGSWEQLKISGLPAAATPPPVPTPPTTAVSIANVTFKTQLRGTFVAAQNNGGGAVTATSAAAQAWETFTLLDANGGSLMSGDSVYIKAGSGQYVQALNGGGSSVNAASANTQAWETFKIVKASGTGAIKTGDIVGLQASTGGWLSAENGGGGNVLAYGGALGSWESFALGIGAPASAPPVVVPPSSDWRLVWSDEFNGTSLDTSKWSYEVQPPGWVNNELEYYTARTDNVRVEAGHLTVEGRHDYYGGAQYSSGRIKTAGHAGISTSFSISPSVVIGAARKAWTRVPGRARCSSTTCASTSTEG